MAPPSTPPGAQVRLRELAAARAPARADDGRDLRADLRHAAREPDAAVAAAQGDQEDRAPPADAVRRSVAWPLKARFTRDRAKVFSHSHRV